MSSREESYVGLVEVEPIPSTFFVLWLDIDINFNIYTGQQGGRAGDIQGGSFHSGLGK
jgi:hypothetical protein